MGGYKMAPRLLAMAAPWVRIQTFLKNTKWARKEQRSDRQKIFLKNVEKATFLKFFSTVFFIIIQYSQERLQIQTHGFDSDTRSGSERKGPGFRNISKNHLFYIDIEMERT